MDNLSFERVWEDVFCYQVQVIAHSDEAWACTRSYTTPDAIESLAKMLRNFSNSRDKILWENGKKGLDYTPSISLEVSCDPWGHVEIEVFFELDDYCQDKVHSCNFVITTELGRLDDFSQRLLRLNEPGIGAKAVLHPEDAETVFPS